MEEKGLVCYNKGCGRKYVEEENDDDACLHHPGMPFFHDAYKGWSCCKKKCTDFTEFLNIKGCTRSKHSNIKPPEPEKPSVAKNEANEEIHYKSPEPMKVKLLQRPPFESPLERLKFSVSSSLVQELAKADPDQIEHSTITSCSKIKHGTPCLNRGCKETFSDESSNDGICTYHPGCPIFHEGLKYWTCCTRRTTDFQAFLNQEGCSTGTHLWKASDDNLSTSTAKCRHDFMQTGTHIIVNIYCKKYDPRDETQTFIKVNPIRLQVQVYFPTSRTYYKNDLELHGMIDPSNSCVNFMPSKVEISLKKAEPMSWNRLDVPRPVEASPRNIVDKDVPSVDALDLSDL